MSKYYIDTEFLEGTQTKRFLGIPYGETKPTIDLISIGIVAEDGREFYAISKDFNLKEAWNRWQQRTGEGDRNNIEPRLYWIRENVLKPIFEEWKAEINGKIVRLGLPLPLNEMKFTYKNFKHCIKCIGKTNKEIAFGVVNFLHGYKDLGNWLGTIDEYYRLITSQKPKEKVELYAYYGAYDHVAFCWLFGKMIDLPKGFPMYCNDLKQILDDKVNKFHKNDFFTAFDFTGKDNEDITLEEKLKHIKMNVRYPSQTNEHNALADARWNKQLHEFLNNL